MTRFFAGDLMLFWRLWCLVYYRTALAHMQATRPTHPDIVYLVLKVRELEEQTNNLI